jgi:hypothetical protein
VKGLIKESEMPSKPSLVATVVPSRAIMLPASFAGSGALLLILFAVLVGCSSFGTSPEVKKDIVTPDARNAILCTCDCDGPVENAVASPNTIRAGADNAVQVINKTTPILNPLVLDLGFGNHVGLRFQNLGIPPKATINSAYIQFTAVKADGAPTTLDIFVVDSPNAPAFTETTDLSGLTFVNAPVSWPVKSWKALERLAPEQTEDVARLVKAVVDHDGYNPLDGAIAFVIKGPGQRSAIALKGATKFQAASLVVNYTPRTITQEFLACGNPSEAAAVCGGKVQTNVAGIAQQCKLANTCTCRVKAAPDPASFSAACNAPCDIKAPDSCDPQHIAKATVAQGNNDPVCVANSPLGSVLFRNFTACEIEGTPNCADIRSTDGTNSCVSIRVFDDDDSLTRYSTPTGRIEFIETPCSEGSRCYGLMHRVQIGNMTFESGGVLGDLFGGSHTLSELTGVGESTVNAPVRLDTSAGQFAGAWIKHSVRGRDGGDTLALARPGDLPVDVGLGGWQPNNVCSVRGMLVKTDNLELFANIRGKLVNQPPTAALDPEPPPVECTDKGPSRAAFALEAAVHDPDNNIASFGWHLGSRTGRLIGTLPTLEVEQPLTTANEPPTSYFFKVIDQFGQYAEATTKVTVVDTAPPTFTFVPPDKTAECTGAGGTFVDIGTATATDTCDALPLVGNKAPGGLLFPLGTTEVKWTARDASNNEASATQKVTIVDTTPPQLTVQLSPTVLWPPNHKMVEIKASITVTDKCDPNPIVKLVSITSNESPNGLGDGNTSPDIDGAALGTDDRTFLLRSERTGPGDGRVYTIVYEASDHSGNTTRRQATVTVPKSQGK